MSTSFVQAFFAMIKHQAIRQYLSIIDLVGGFNLYTPLKNDGVRQLGWLFHPSEHFLVVSQLWGNKSHVPITTNHWSMATSSLQCPSPLLPRRASPRYARHHRLHPWPHVSHRHGVGTYGYYRIYSTPPKKWQNSRLLLKNCDELLVRSFLLGLAILLLVVRVINIVGSYYSLLLLIINAIGVESLEWVITGNSNHWR